VKLKLKDLERVFYKMVEEKADLIEVSIEGVGVSELVFAFRNDKIDQCYIKVRDMLNEKNEIKWAKEGKLLLEDEKPGKKSAEEKKP